MSIDVDTSVETGLRQVRRLLERRQSLAEQQALALAHGHPEAETFLELLTQVEELLRVVSPATWRCCYPSWMLVDSEGGPENDDPRACWICQSLSG